MGVLNMMVISLMINLKEMVNIFGKIMNIILANGKMVLEMEKVYYIIKTEILNMMVILLMIKQKEMENILMKMVIII